MLTTTDNEALFNQFEKTTDYSVVEGKNYYKRINGTYSKYFLRLKLYKAATVLPSTFNGGTATYNIVDNTISFDGTGSDNWSLTQPTLEDNQSLYAIYKDVYTTATTVTIEKSEWSSPALNSNISAIVLTKYYEKDEEENYFQTADSEIKTGKTYYIVNDSGTYTAISTTPAYLTLYTVASEFTLPYKYYDKADMTVYGVSKEDSILLDTNTYYSAVDTANLPSCTYDLTNDTTAFEYTNTQDTEPYEYVRASFCIYYEKITNKDDSFHYSTTQDSLLQLTTKQYYVKQALSDTYYAFNTLSTGEHIPLYEGSSHTLVSDVENLNVSSTYYIKPSDAYIQIDSFGYGYEQAVEGTDYYFTSDGSTYAKVDDPYSCFSCLRSFYYVKKANNTQYYTLNDDGNTYTTIPSVHHYEKIKLINGKNDKETESSKYRYILTTDYKFIKGKEYYKLVDNSYVRDKAIYDTVPSETSDERFKSGTEYLTKSGDNYVIADTSDLIGWSVNYYRDKLENLPLNYTTVESEVYYEKVDNTFTEIGLTPGTVVKQLNYYKSNAISYALKGETVNTITQVYYTKKNGHYTIAQLTQGETLTKKYYKGFFSKASSLEDNTLYYRYDSNSGIYESQSPTQLITYYVGIVPTSDTSYLDDKTYYTKENNTYTVTSGTGSIEVADNRVIAGNTLVHNGFDSDIIYYEKQYNSKDYYTKSGDVYTKVEDKSTLPETFPANTYYEKGAIQDTYYTLNSSTGEYETVNNENLKDTGWQTGTVYYVISNALIQVPEYETAIKDNKFYFTKTSFNQGCYKYIDSEESYSTENPLYFYRVESGENTITIQHTEDIAYRDMCIAPDGKAATITLDGEVRLQPDNSLIADLSEYKYSWIAITHNGTSYVALSKDGYIATITDGTVSIKHQFGIKGKDWQDLFYRDDVFYLLSASGKLYAYISNREFTEVQLDPTHYWKAFFIRKIGEETHICALATHGYYYDTVGKVYYQLAGDNVAQATEYAISTFPTSGNSTFYFWKDYEALLAKRDTSITQTLSTPGTYMPTELENMFDRTVAIVQDLETLDDNNEVDHAVSADGIRVELSQDTQTYYPTFVDGEGEVRTLFIDDDKSLSYNPSINTLNVDTIKVSTLEAASLRAKVEGVIDKAAMLQSDPQHNTRAGELSLSLKQDTEDNTPYIRVEATETPTASSYYYSTDLVHATSRQEGKIYYYMAKLSVKSTPSNTIRYYIPMSNESYAIIDQERYSQLTTKPDIYYTKEDTTGKKTNVFTIESFTITPAASTPVWETTAVQYYYIPYSNNTALGYNAGSSNKTGSNNIYIGANVTGTDGENNKIRIGDSNQITIIAGTTDSASTESGAVTISGGLGVKGKIYGGEVYGAVWNDLVDAISVPEETELEYGYCYATDGEKYWKTKERCERGTLGIHSDTCGFGMGMKEGKALWCAVAGFVLAHVDKIYPTGTALTSAPNGLLTKMKPLDKILHPERLVGIFWKKEKKLTWGTKNRNVQVNGRSWVKIV